MSNLHVGDAVTVRFFMPSPALAPYISTYYLTEVRGPAETAVQDWLHPEWANVRYAANPQWQAAIGSEPLRTPAPLIGTGPTCQAAHFILGPSRIWGIGVLPLGWARLCSGDAAIHADRFTDARSEPAYAGFAPLPGLTFGAEPDPAAEAARIDAYLLTLLDQRPVPEDEARIRAAHAALHDPDSRVYYDRKRAQGKKHNAALICLARRRTDVIQRGGGDLGDGRDIIEQRGKAGGHRRSCEKRLKASLRKARRACRKVRSLLPDAG